LIRLEMAHVSAGESLVDAVAPGLDSHECRFCLGSEGADLIAPCQCSGSSKWVHRHCLDRWRATGGPCCFTHCPTCQFPYILELRHASTEFEQRLRKRRCRLVRRTVKNFVLGALVLQALLCTLAALIYLIDQKHFLVRLMPFKSIDSEDDHGRYLNALWHHKTTYYVSAIVVSLALLGLTLCATCCWHACRPSRSVRRVVGPDRVYCDSRCPCDHCTAYWQCCDCFQCAESCGDCRELCCRQCCQECLNSCPGSSSGPCPLEGLECPGGWLAIVVIIVLAFAGIGLVFAFATLVIWVQRVCKRYFQLQQLRELTDEYVVKDLSTISTTSPQPSAPPLQQLMEPSAPPPEAGDLEAGAPVLATPVAVQESLTQDLQAIYGYAF